MAVASGVFNLGLVGFSILDNRKKVVRKELNYEFGDRREDPTYWR